ncbi:ATP-binding response regulator [Meridianimarinicoccus sp. RP-17]
MSGGAIYLAGCGVIGTWSVLSPVPIPAVAIAVMLGLAMLPARHLWLVAFAVAALLWPDLAPLSAGRIGEIEPQLLRVALAAEVGLVLGLSLGMALRQYRTCGGQALTVAACAALATFAAGALAPVAEAHLAAMLGIAADPALPLDRAGWLRHAAEQARLACAVAGLVLVFGWSTERPDATPLVARAPRTRPAIAVLPATTETETRPDAPGDGAVPPVDRADPDLFDAPAPAAAPPAPVPSADPAPPAATGLPDAGLPVRYRPLVPAQLLEELKARFDAQAAQAGVEIEIRVGNGAFDPVAGDLHRLRAILDNLVRNALDHAGCGCLTLSYGRAAGQSPCLGIWTVADDGCGYPPALAAVPELSTEFGLGLAIVRAAVATLDGTLQVSTRPGHGTSVEARLPETHAAAAPPDGAGRVLAYLVRDAKGRAQLSRAPVAQCPAARAHVMLVDDNPTLRNVAGAMLGKIFGEVTLAGDAVTALSCFRTRRPDLVLVDLVMPGTGGDVLTTALRRTDPDLPIVGLLAAPNAAETRRMTEAGANEVVVKPLGRALITGLVQRHLPDASDRADRRTNA